METLSPSVVLNGYTQCGNAAGKINISPTDTWWYVLECIKAMYGLNDAPLAWQLILQEYLISRGGIQSSFEECFYFWPQSPGSIEALMTTDINEK